MPRRGKVPMADRWPVEFIDSHFHAGTDAVRRRTSIAGAVREYGNENGAVWVKRHDGETLSSTRRWRSNGVLVGGVAVIQWADLVDSRSLERLLRRERFRPRPIVSLPTRDIRSLLDHLTNRRVTTALEDVIEMAWSCGAVIATGHLPAERISALLGAVAARDDAGRVLVTHAFHPLVNASPLVQELTEEFDVAFEHTELTHLLGRIGTDAHLSVLREVGNLLYSSDFGQPTSPTVGEWRALSERWFTEAALTGFRRREITLTAAADLLLRP